MVESEKVIRLKRFPLEAEATASMAQIELAKLSHSELLSYAKQTTLLMSQLRHYSSELIAAFERLGYAVQGEDSKG